MSMEIRDLKNIDFDSIYCAFEQAFSDYEIGFEKNEVRSMLKRRGFTPELSFAAFDKDNIVAFTLNGIGMYNNVLTAYDTGTGTVKEYRGKGIAKDIFMYSIPYLKRAGIKQYLLEVLQNNAKAISVYQKLGFRIMREFDCFRQARGNISRLMESGQMLPIEIVPMDLESISDVSCFCDFSASWQNSMDSIRRAGTDLVCLGAFITNRLVGYCVFDPLTGDLSQIAVHREYRRKRVASCLFQEAIKRITSDTIKVLNIPSACHSLPAFLKESSMELTGKQFEMVLSLSDAEPPVYTE